MVDSKNKENPSQLGMFVENVSNPLDNITYTPNYCHVDTFSIIPNVFKTEKGTQYLQSPGVLLVSQTVTNVEALDPLLQSYDKSLGFNSYSDDEPLDHGSQACKIAGQLCYMSLGSKRTHNKDAEKYFNNIKKQEHHSVTEHATYGLVFYGISRSLLAELTRHRHISPSVLSQRYCDGNVLRFVERPEYASDPDLHTLFECRIDHAAHAYKTLTDLMMAKNYEKKSALGQSSTEARKSVQQTSRSLLPNEVETVGYFTANARSWREFIEKRATAHAEPEIRRLAVCVYEVLSRASNHLFSDYRKERIIDGSYIIIKK